MTRVVFLLNLDKSWMGGVNYYKNLLQAIGEYAGERLSVLVLVPKGADICLLGELPSSIEVRKSAMVTRGSVPWFLRKVLIKLLKRDYMLSRYLKGQGVSVLSHYGEAASCPGLKILSWIPDFQEKHCPAFFMVEEISSRDRDHLRQAQMSDAVILSSHNAAQDFARFYAAYKDKAAVLQFVPTMTYTGAVDGDVLERYGLPEKFFFLPNQYWAHKNHKIVLEALAALKEIGEGEDIVVVSTGGTEDYRNPTHIEELRAYIRNRQLEESYRILGMIPYADVQSLAKLCHAYINPSFFEGWSTTVEEAKYQGKCILLSDIGIHREQNPKHGVFFNPNDARELAGKMLEVWTAPRVETDIAELKSYYETMRKKFAEDYVKIVESVRISSFL
ncbi:glycosyltransferase family 1 protein [Selenomonas sp. TAMA-11512]|uniref:glycosyltransferase family 4 protein n=1 Tax=Selenomonas sp. TAMA-11512 TaxID=3095337 RepID=UPI00308D9827|nr:glycosyltransferase family 1 protein [Selenomonas sp. TAMA-11512]